MALQFIDEGPIGIGPSKSDRRIIRSHVMKGKNAGRPRPSMRRQMASGHVKRTLPTLRMLGPGYQNPGRQPLWHDLCLTSFPQELDPESIRLMHRWFFDISDTLFPPQFCTKFDIVKSLWVNYVLADEAYFHCTLAISASYVDFCERKPVVSLQTLHHISKAYALVNLKLSGRESVSDSAIAAVVSLAIYQQIHHLHATGLIHLKGLYRMIQLRGGIARLMQENRALALKPMRLDVELALQTGLPPIFCSDALGPAQEILGDSHINKNQLINAASRLSSTMLIVVSFAHILNDREGEGQTKLDPLSFTETLVFLLYRLMEVGPLSRTHFVLGDPYNDVAHLALLAFMTTLLPEYSGDGSSYSLLSARLENAIQDLYVTSEQPTESTFSLLLWTLFIGGVSVLKQNDYRWLILETCERLDLYDWPAIRHQLCIFPWIYILHDIPGRRLWENAKRMSTDISPALLQLQT